MDQQDLTQAKAPASRGLPSLRPPALATGLRRAAILYPFLILFIVLSVSSGPFFTKVNLLDILDQQASTLIIAAAGTLVLVAGGIDLSVGAIYALAGVTAAHLALFASPGVAILAGVAVGLGVGLVNGVIVTAFRINALIATLAMSFVVSGLASLVTGGNLVIDYSHPGFADLARTSFLTVNTSTWTMLAVVVALAVVLARTTAGRYMYASGSNAEAARLSGVRVQLIKLITFVISGGAAALCGVIDASRVLSAQASNGETTLTFTVLAGIVVGGTSILGGEGAMWRTVVGVLFIALIGNGFDLLGLNPLYEQIALGGILLIAVGYDAWSRLRQGLYAVVPILQRLADGQRTSRTWLVHSTRVTRGQAAEHMAAHALAREHRPLLEALAEGYVITKSVALQLAKWTRAIPAEFREQAEDPGCRSQAGADLRALAAICAEIRYRTARRTRTMRTTNTWTAACPWTPRSTGRGSSAEISLPNAPPWSGRCWTPCPSLKAAGTCVPTPSDITTHSMRRCANCENAS
jgi:ribose transport system permease protein